MLKGRKMSQNSGVRMSFRGDSVRGMRSIVAEAVGGVGGAEGIKKEGTQAMVDCFNFKIC